MPPKAKLPAPIDRPLSRAYVREFTGWSTAEPPGLCDPTSLRVMDNVLIGRDGSAQIRPGMRYLSYSEVPTPPYGSGGGSSPGTPAPPIQAVISTADEADYHSAHSHHIAAWDDTHVAAMHAHHTSGQVIRMLTVTEEAITAGPEVVIPVDAYNVASTIYRMGDLLVVLFKRTQELYTFTYDEGTEVFVEVAAPVVDWGGGGVNDGGRFLVWGPDQILLYRAYNNGTSLYGKLQFAQWSEGSWTFGALYTHDMRFGSPDYTYFARLGPDEAPMALGYQGVWSAPGAEYVTVTGSYPDAPVVETGGEPSGILGFHTFEFFSVPGYEHVLRAIPLEPGAYPPYTPLAAGADEFAWGYTPITVVPGETEMDPPVVVEGDIVYIGPTNEFYDIALTETADGVWASYISGPAGANWLQAHRVGDVPTQLSGVGGTDVNVADSDHQVRCIVPVGDSVMTNWWSVAHGQHWVAVLGLFDTDEVLPELSFGTSPVETFIGTHEAFYLNDGTKAYLCAVREEDGLVGFRALVHDMDYATLYHLDDPVIDFDVTQPREVLNFSELTTYVKYLQIDNKIFALSDAGENMRVFSVGEHKEAKALEEITRPEWANSDKLKIVHPEAQWIIDGEPAPPRVNLLRNPSFERNLDHWWEGPNTRLSRPKDPPNPIAGERVARITSAPERINYATQPLHDVAATGLIGWDDGGGNDSIEEDGDWMRVVRPEEKGEFFARSRLYEGINPEERYQVAFDFNKDEHVRGLARVRFFGVNGAQVGKDMVQEIEHEVGVLPMRFISKGFDAPKGAVRARAYIGGDNLERGATWVAAKNLVFCRADEPTHMFTGNGVAGLTEYYFWADGENQSRSVYHPPKNVVLRSEKVTIKPGKPLVASLTTEAADTGRNAVLELRMFNKRGLEQAVLTGTPTDNADAIRLEVGAAGTLPTVTQADLRLTIPNVPRGEFHFVDAAMIEPGTDVAGSYFDGSTNDTGDRKYSWRGKKHGSASELEEWLVAATVPEGETRTDNTLIASGGPGVNEFQFGFFYTISNEVGESAASKITIRRAQRAWSDWVWETPNAAGEPSGTDTDNPDMAADQLVAIIPDDVFEDAMAQGATHWSLYMFTWSDQEAAPVIANKVGTRELETDSTHETRGWLRVGPSTSDVTDTVPLPTKENRLNFSDPSRGGQGLVASDRMIVVNDPTAAAVIRWSSNQAGEYTNFTAHKGGGYKTLTSGNLFVPAAVKLWQNPQSADTICILCLGTDGHSTSYYMAPSQIAQQADALNVMGFEETTATEGTTSPYGVEVFNNSLYHPLEDQLMKSTASNYNINHKSQTDLIRNMWEELTNKYWIISSVHDSRLYYIVTNPNGEPVEDGCNGNEIWVFDAASKTGTWSRFTIQAHSLRKMEFGGKIFMSVVRPDGIYYLDPHYGFDDVVDDEGVVVPTPISWALESNTQGANRAHDAWCHLQQLSVILGNFQGGMRYGLRSVDLNGKPVEMSKVVRDNDEPTALMWDIEDFLQIRRDLKEWFFFAESIEGEASSGQINLVQFRYAPISVNVGYENGSIETFEYGRDYAQAESSVTSNGIPLPLTDSRRP